MVGDSQVQRPRRITTTDHIKLSWLAEGLRLVIRNGRYCKHTKHEVK